MEKTIGSLFGLELVLRVSKKCPIDNDRMAIQIERAEKFIKELFDKESRMPTEEEIRAELQGRM